MKTKLMKTKIRENEQRLQYLKSMLVKNNMLRSQGLEVSDEIWNNAMFYIKNRASIVFCYGEYQGEKGLYEAVRKGNEYALEYAVSFIEVRPYFFRSGYMYVRLLRYLNNAPLSESQRERYLVVKTKYQELLRKYREKRGW